MELNSLLLHADDDMVFLSNKEELSVMLKMMGKEMLAWVRDQRQQDRS
jgi:hypothetical protein